MSKLDRELAAAIAEGEGPAPPRDEVLEGHAPERGQPQALSSKDRPRFGPNTGLVVMLLLLGAGMLTLVLTSFKSSVMYSKGVDELIAERDRLVGRTVRVEGTLVKGSLQRREEPCAYRFLLERNGAKVLVDYPQCSIPDTFRDVPYTDVAVTAEGRLDAGGDFRATQIMAKCPSKYEGDSKPLSGTTGGARREMAGATEPGRTLSN